MEHLKKYISETNEQMANLEQLQEEKTKIEKMKNSYNDKINFVMDTYYNLKIK